MTRKAAAKNQKIQRWLPSLSGCWESSAIEKVIWPPSAAITAVAIAATSISSEPTSV